MLTHQFRTNIAYFLRSRMRFAPFLDTIAELARYANVTYGLMQGIAVGGNGLNTSAQQIHSSISQLNGALKNVNHKKFFRAESDFVGELEDLWTEGAEDHGIQVPKWVADLSERIEEFSEVWNIFLSEQSGANALPVLLAAQELQIKFETAFQILEAVLTTLGNQDKPTEGEESFSLYLPSEMTLRDFVARLKAFQSMYSVICDLLKVNEHDHPLRTVEIESGSFWVKFFGDAKVLGFITAMVEKAVTWGFRNFTPEGRLGAIPRKVASVESLFDLTQKLKAAGIEVEGAEEKIRQAAMQLTNELGTLLQGQTSVTVNQTKLTYQDEILKQHAEEVAKFPLLDYDSAASQSQPKLPPPT